ncbi:3-hydroxyacyl-CoA dehydrogenase [Sulfitobacter sp. S223]|uniref:3-hydroxyacyl-CoA dehydrogenase NAD-binding domain-containing protein n=1 Tax=Sulfitobacter sp. S223 TaxID=2867023 RepID=UPI0021A3E0CA|nr:3-hydroxyacyl-CoA dehydrogenase NAD-binding domain-containing protein [Sulfitobacter sp. S223]UWR26003.1 3-hydroxyacyl-CoA dehydrogenase [Sulfitobacter sp. S223]
MTADLEDTQIAILGAGLIGACWAALFVHHGATVRVWDPQRTALDKLAERMTRPLAQLKELEPESASQGKVVYHDMVEEAVEGAVLIQENGPENLDLKHALYTRVEPMMAPDAILASSTSALTWSELASGFSDPDRLITAHPFNPPHLVPLVETFGHDADRLNRAEAIYRAAGRVPVRMNKDATGHIANRLSSALWREAVHMVAEGIADVAAIDAALVNGPGLRWSVIGAHMAYHLGGGEGGMAGYLSHLGPSQERRWASLGVPSLTQDVCTALVDGVAAEAAGRDIATLEQQRDTALIALLKARQ